MDGFVIPSSHAEEVITDEMLDQIAADLERDMAHDEQHHESSAPRGHGNCTSGKWGAMPPDHSPHDSSLTGAVPPANVSEDERDEITSDDSGDFVFFTSNVTNANVYDLVRDYIAYSKQQEREIEELEKACELLESEQKTLWTHAVSATYAEQRQQDQNGGGSPSSSPAVFNPDKPTAEVVDPLEDEFDDVRSSTTTRTCVYMDPTSAAMKADPFRYSTPSISVGGAAFSNVFKTGFLFMAEATDGSWVFFNDSEKYKMSVKYVFGAQSAITPGPHARLTSLPNGEREVCVTVMPEETEVLVRGSVNGFRNVSVAQPIDASFVNVHVKTREQHVTATLTSLTARLKKASVAFVSSEEALSLASETEGFVDPSFPPLTASIYRPDVDEVFLWALPWRRPDEYLSAEDAAEVRLFRGHVHPIDVSPGDGGDYYFCSAACIAAEYPMKVRALFRHPVSVSAGKAERRLHAYRVTLNTGGWWRTTLLDDYLPASKKGPDYGRCQYDLRKLWYPLLEKAYAKAHNAYAAIQFGDPLEALQDLLGFPTCRFDDDWGALLPESDDDGTAALKTETVDKTARDTLFRQLAAYLERGYIVLLSAPEEGPAESELTSVGFAYGMSYALRRVVVDASGEVLVQVRCPTLTPGWRGRWSPGSAEWASRPALQQLCGASGESAVYDAVWLDWSEAMTLFDGGGVCYTRFHYEDYRVRGHFAPEMGPSVALEVRVTGATALEAYCLLSQEDDRGTPESSPNHSLNPLMLFVTQGKSDNVQQIAAVCSPDPDTPAEQLNFVLGRDVALWYRFEPDSRPYYIIPRGRSITTVKSFTLGLLTSALIDDVNVSVRCVTLQDDTPILRNKREFRPSDVLPGKATLMQHRRPDGSLREVNGTNLAFPS